MKFKRQTTDLAPAIGEKFLMPSKQILILETISSKITRKEFNSEDMSSLKSMINGRSMVDKLGNNDSDSDTEERGEPVKQKKKKRKQDFVTSEDIGVIVKEAVMNAMENMQQEISAIAGDTKWCSHCKYQGCFDKNGKKKQEWHKFIANRTDFEGHYVGECTKKKENGNFKRTGKWCGKCKAYEHSYAECTEKNSQHLNKNRS